MGLGRHWKSLNEDPDRVVYRGSVSKVRLDFDANDNLWNVTRLQDGDQSGWGLPSIAHRPLNHIHWNWIRGQLSKQGTDIYLEKIVP